MIVGMVNGNLLNLRKIMSRKKLGGVLWWLTPMSKRPFANSTVAIRDLIEYLSENFDTVQEIYDNINYCDEGKKILQKYIDAGYGNKKWKDFSSWDD